MLVSVDKLLSSPVLSLHTAGRIANIVDLIISPHDLSVAAFILDVLDPEIDTDLLRPIDIREFSPIGVIVDSADVFTKAGEVVKLDEIINLQFSLSGLKVVTKSGKKLGAVANFTIDTDNFKVHQLSVRRQLFRNFIGEELLVSHSQVIKVTDSQITVKDSVLTAPAEPEFTPNFINPFRQAPLAPAPDQTPDAADIGKV